MKTIALLMFSLALASAQMPEDGNVTFNTIQHKPLREWGAKFFGKNPVGNGPEAEFIFRQVLGDFSAMELDLGSTVLRGGGDHTAPSLSMRREGQGLFIAALPMGGTLSLYRRVGSEKREWLRISYAGIQVADVDGNLQQAFNGKIRPGCSAVVTEGLITGEDCGAALLRATEINYGSKTILRKASK